MKKHKRPILRRQLATTVQHLGKQRPITVEINTLTGILSVRPFRCRKAKTYAIADLFTWGPQLQLNLK